MRTLMRVLVFGLLAVLVGQALLEMSRVAIDQVQARLEVRK